VRYNPPQMVQPVVVPRAQHPISRKDIDPDALKVLYRLHQHNFAAYLVGGSVRDLLLGRRPKDFDIGTDAHPYQVKRLFRNCWIIGRRFRLAHVRFGTKNVEVATFRRLVPADEAPPEIEPVREGVEPGDEERDRLIHRDNTFGTPEEDAFRRDFTVNALFYDISTFSIIDYVGGLQDIRAGVIRSIGNPRVRFQEDPVRMLRAVAMASRLDFMIDPPIFEAIASERHHIALAAPARLVEEFHKILRAGASERAFRILHAHGLLEPLAPELHEGAGDALWRSLAAVDAYRRRFDATPESLTNAILIGSLLVPLGFHLKHSSVAFTDEDARGREPRMSLGLLPLARRDIERLRQILGLQRRLRDGDLSPRARRALMHRGSFQEALTWLDLHGDAPETLEHWRGFIEATGPIEPDAQTPGAGEGAHPHRRRRRGGRRRGGPRPA